MQHEAGELPEAADAGRLTAALFRAGALNKGRVRAVSVERSRKTVLSRVARLRLEYEGEAEGAPRSLFLKTGLPERASAEWTSGRQEVAFYTTVAPKVGAGVLARCFEAQWDRGTNAWTLVLEDLEPTHVLASAWPIPPTFEECQRILRAWAGFHAVWWDDSRLGADVGIWLSRNERERRRDGSAALFMRFADRFGDLLSRERRALYERFLAEAPRFWARYETRRHLTIAHGDAHFWNCFLAKDGADVRLFDWDAWRIGVATEDVAYMMAMHWYPERRRRFEALLLDGYSAALEDHGVGGYDRQMLGEDYRRSVLGLIVRPVWQAMNDLPPVIWWNNLERIFLAVEDLGCAELLK